MACESPVTPQERRSASASAGRRPARDTRRTPGMAWLAGLSRTRGTSREVTISLDGAAAAHEHALQAVQNRQPGARLKMVEQPFAEFGSLHFPEAVERLAGDVGEGAPAEVGHD